MGLVFTARLSALTVYVSSNLQGRFNAHDPSGRDDFMLDFAAALITDRASDAGIYVDLGNGFYPGALSRFSYGALTADYFSMLKLDAGLVAANDLNLGADNLDFLRRARGLNLLSANILRDGQPLFFDRRIVNTSLGRLGIVAMTSRSSYIDFAEKELFGIKISENFEQLGLAIRAAKEEGAEHIILITGMSVPSVIAALEAHRDIELALMGGDFKGDILGKKFSSLQLADGRTLVAMPDNAGYYRLKLQLQNGILVPGTNEYVPVLRRSDNRQIPSDFLRRRELWRNGYQRSEAAASIPLPESGFLFNAEYLGALLRAELACEVAVINPQAVTPTMFREQVSPGLMREKNSDDYRIFHYQLFGDELELLLASESSLHYSGITRGALNIPFVQGYTLKKHNRYRVCSSQAVMERLQRRTPRRFSRQNTWRSTGEIAAAKLRSGEFRDTPILAAIADSLWRLRIEAVLSNMVENAKVTNERPVKTPPGQPKTTYLKWGLENTVDISIYNRRHEFVLTPYINYVRQDELFLQNLLRTTFTYNYNLDFFLRPYHKSQIDTVVVPVDDTRPTLVRETVGAQIMLGELTGRVGFGFEKKVLDPVMQPTWGFETTLKFSHTFWQRITYRMNLDSFFSSDTPQGRWQIRSEISNAMVFSLYEPLSLTFRHRWFYFFSPVENGSYDASIFTTSVDLRTNFKVY